MGVRYQPGSNAIDDVLIDLYHAALHQIEWAGLALPHSLFLLLILK